MLKPIPIWIVRGNIGFGADVSEWVVAAYDSGHMAQRHAHAANEWLRQHKMHDDQKKSERRGEDKEECPYDLKLGLYHDRLYGSSYDVVEGVSLYSHLDQFLGLD